MIDVYQSHKTLKNLQLLHDTCAESKVYRLIDTNEAYKEFKLCKTTPEILANKEKKVKILMNEKDLHDYCILPKKIIIDEEHNKFLGILMDYFNGFHISGNLNLNDTIDALLKVKNILLILKEKEIYYYDIHRGNFLVNKVNNEINVRLVDMDNIRLQTIPHDYNGSALKQYLSIGGKLNFNAVIYIFNWTTYVLLTNSDYFFEENKANIDEELKKIDLYVKDIIRFCVQLFYLDADQIGDHEFLIDHVSSYIKSLK